MFVWLASYPKSGNTLIRSMLAAYFFSKDGVYDFDLIKNIKQFPKSALFERMGIDLKNEKEVVKNYIRVQETFNKKNSLQFLKTHSYLFNIENNPFTNLENSLGVIYIIRDPRNVLISASHHNQKSNEETIKDMTDGYVINKNDGTTLPVYTGNWSSNYKSWKSFKSVNKYLLVKYEDLISDPEKCFTSVLKFTYKISNSSLKIDKNKLDNVLKTTTFEYLQNLEKKGNFKEATSVTKKIDFFKYGPKNDGKKGIPKKIIENLEKNLNKEMKELGYL